MKSLNKVLIIQPTKTAMKNIKTNIKPVFKSTKPLISKISKLNSKIKSWCNYYSIPYHSLKSFKLLNSYIYMIWWVWAIKHHPTRSKRWIYNKYIFSDTKRKWRFGVSKTTHNVILDPTLCKIRKIRQLKIKISPYPI